MTDRALSTVVGMTILVGLTAALAVTILVVSGTVVDEAQSTAKQQQVEYSMTQFAETAERVSSDSTGNAEFTVTGSDSGSASVNRSAGHVTVVLVENGTSETIMDTDLGVYRQQLGDGSEVAYQGGGVWRVQDGYADLVSPPAFHYRERPEPTLTFPNTRVRGNVSGGGDVSGQLRIAERREGFPSDGTTRVVGDYVYVDVESEYCRGWEEHVDQRTDGLVEESCEESNQTTAPNELRVNMSVASPERTSEDDADDDTDTDGADWGLFTENDLTIASNTGGQINGSIAAGGTLDWPGESNFALDGEVQDGVSWTRDPHDQEIQDYVDQANPVNWRSFCGADGIWNCKYSGASNQPVYIDDFNDGAGEVEFDLSQGNITLVVDDDLSFSQTSKWDVTNHETGNVVKVYATGDLLFQDTVEIGVNEGTPSDYQPVTDGGYDSQAQALQFYLSSDATLAASGDSMAVDALISAPATGTGNSSKFQHTSGTFNFAGAVYASSMEFQSSTVNIYHETPEAWEPAGGWGGGGDDGGGGGDGDGGGDGGSDDSESAELYYLHLSETVLEIEE